MAEDRLKVLYVTGFGRSGTTILDNILGQLDGVFAAGELHYIWDRSLEQNRLCACGEAFADCRHGYFGGRLQAGHGSARPIAREPQPPAVDLLQAGC
jgi:hypothetical protein